MDFPTCFILDRHHIWRSHDPTSVRIFPFVKKKKTLYPLFKKTQLFVVQNFFLKKDASYFHSHCFLYPPGYPPGYLPSYPPGYPPGYPLGYPPGYLMLPNLTNQFIKLSDGDLQCESNSDIFVEKKEWI